MNRQTLQLLGILLNPRITAKPLEILWELRRRGIQRLPRECYTNASGRPHRRQMLALIRQWLDGEMLSRHDGRWVLNSFMPPFPGPSFDRLFENLLSGRHLSPVSAFLAITASCPHRCWHCSVRGRRTGELPTAVWDAAIRSLQDLGMSIVGFTGGEPLSRPDLPLLVEAACHAGASTIVFSAGAGMTDTVAHRLRKAGLWAFCVSLDHPDPVEHDRLRGLPGSHANALAALRIARQAGFYTMVSSVATRRFVEDGLFNRIYDLARQLGLDEYRIVEPMPCGELSSATDNTLLLPHHVAELRNFHTSTNRQGRLPKVCAFNQVESPEIFGCGGGTQHLYIDSAGEVCPCDFTPLSFGNISTRPLESIWRRMNRAMGNNPRRHCFIQKHHQLIRRHASEGFPLKPEMSEQICAEAGSEPLSDFLAMVTGQTTPLPDRFATRSWPMEGGALSPPRMTVDGGDKAPPSRPGDDVRNDQCGAPLSINRVPDKGVCAPQVT